MLSSNKPITENSQFLRGFLSLRISDLLRLRVIDVKGKSHVEIKEQKTGKIKRFPLLGNLQSMIDEYIKCKSDNDYLFKSRNGKNKPITRVMAYLIINNAAQKADITDNIGTHTLRKTFGYHHYQTFHDVAILQYLLNHSSPSITLLLIGSTIFIYPPLYINFFIIKFNICS